MNDTKKEIKLGEFVSILTSNGGVIGVLGACYTYLNGDGEEEKLYRICVGKQIVDIYEHEITGIYTLADVPDKETFLREEIEKKYDIKCFDKDGKMLSNSTIMANMIDDNKWDDLSEDEKKEFVMNIKFTKEDVVEIINVLFNERYDNQKMHDKRVTALDNAIELMDKFKLIKECAPWSAECCNLVYKELGIEKLINSI